MTTKPAPADQVAIADLRARITELVANNAVAMVQNAIDAVNEQGQYQAIKFLFEMIGLYPAMTDEQSEVEDSLAKVLLQRLGIEPESVSGRTAAARENLGKIIPYNEKESRF